jgi:hypothetical protein
MAGQGRWKVGRGGEGTRTQDGNAQHEEERAQHVHALLVAALIHQGADHVGPRKAADRANHVEHRAADRDALAVQEGLGPAQHHSISNITP